MNIKRSIPTVKTLHKPIVSSLFLASVVALAARGNAGVLFLHNTGEGLTQGDLDPNWSMVILPDGTVGNAISATDPNNNWITPTPPNTWISVARDGVVPAGVYRYSTTFTIAAGFDPATAQISGHWWADEPNTPNHIELNGTQVSDFHGAGWSDPSAANAAFDITSGFVAGLNILTFLVENTDGPGGTLLQNLSGNVSPIPEPSSVIAGSLACLAFGGIRLWRNQRKSA